MTRQEAATFTEVRHESQQAGHSISAIKRAAERLKVVKTSHDFPRKTHWSLPVSSLLDDPPPADAPQLVHPDGLTELTELTRLTGLTGPQSAQLVQSAHTPRASERTARSVDCSDYRAHQSGHRRVGVGWVCDTCAEARVSA